MEDFVLTNENYYSDEANQKYMSVHQYFDFVGTLGYAGCEERAMAILNGEYKEEPTLAFLIGSYVDSYFEGTLETFKDENPELFATTLEYAVPFSTMREEHPNLFTRNGRLKSEWGKNKLLEKYPKYIKPVKELKACYKQAQKMVERCTRDEYFMKFMSGEKQKIFTANLFGCDWKCKLDSYIPDVAIVDLKTSANIHKAWRVEDYGYATFVEYWGYLTQMAVYQKVVEVNVGKKLPCYIAVVTKEDEPEIEVIHIDQFSLDNALNEVQMNLPSVLMVKEGDIEPTRCGKCNYCISTKKLFKPINYRDLIIGE